MTSADRQALKAAVDALMRALNGPPVLRAPWVPCPVHGTPVGVSEDGHLKGRCDSCAVEAAQAILVLAAA